MTPTSALARRVVLVVRMVRLYGTRSISTSFFRHTASKLAFVPVWLCVLPLGHPRCAIPLIAK